MLTERQIFQQVVFGGNCSPFLLGALLSSFGTSPEFSIWQKSWKYFYTDNHMTSVEIHHHVDEARQLLFMYQTVGNSRRILPTAQLHLQDGRTLVWIKKRGTNSNFSVRFVNRINKKLIFCRGRSEELR